MPNFEVDYSYWEKAYGTTNIDAESMDAVDEVAEKWFNKEFVIEGEDDLKDFSVDGVMELKDAN